MATNLETKIGRIRNNVTAALAKIAEKGVTVPEGAGSDDLETLIDAITGGGSASIPVCSVAFEYDTSNTAINRLVCTRFIDGAMSTETPSPGSGGTVSDIVCGSFMYMYVTGAGTGRITIPDEMETIENYYYDFGYQYLVRMPSSPGTYTIECYVE